MIHSTEHLSFFEKLETATGKISAIEQQQSARELQLLFYRIKDGLGHDRPMPHSSQIQAIDTQAGECS